MKAILAISCYSAYSSGQTQPTLRLVSAKPEMSARLIEEKWPTPERIIGVTSPGSTFVLLPSGETLIQEHHSRGRVN
jgi:hypothetical protein